MYPTAYRHPPANEFHPASAASAVQAAQWHIVDMQIFSMSCLLLYTHNYRHGFSTTAMNDTGNLNRLRH